MLAVPKSALSTVPQDFNICFATSKKVREIGPAWVDVGGLYSLMVDGKMKETYTAGSTTTLGVGISVPGAFGSFSAEGTFTQTSSGAEHFPTLVGKIVNEQTRTATANTPLPAACCTRCSPRSGSPAVAP